MSYHIAREGRQLGTFTEEEVLEALESGTILPTDELWTEGMEEWQPVSEVIEAEDEHEVPSTTPILHAEEEQSVRDLDLAESAETQVLSPAPAPVEVAPPEPVPDFVSQPWPADAPAVVAAPVVVPAPQPVVLYRSVGPSLMPGQYGIAGSAIASMVLGILSLVGCFFTGIPAIICGHMARNKIRRSGGVYSGEGLAVTGLILGYVTSALAVLWMVLLFVGVNVPLSQSMQGWSTERQVRAEGHELALALKRYASAHANKYPAKMELLVSEHFLDQAQLTQLQSTELGTSWKGPHGWKYLGAGLPDSDASDAPLLISFPADSHGKHLVIYQDAVADKAEVRTK